MVYFQNYIIICGLCGGSTISVIKKKDKYNMICMDCGVDREIETVDNGGAKNCLEKLESMDQWTNPKILKIIRRYIR